MNKFNLKAGLVIGDGARSIEIEKVTNETIYVRGAQDNNPLRFIPILLIETLLNAINENKISIQDISRKYRSDKNLPHLFDALQLNFDKYILGYDATIQKICEYILGNITTTKAEINTHYSIIIPKPFLLLAGISGTGKSRFVREQAAASGSVDQTYKLISVRPDWHEPSDLLGYISRLKQGEAEYIVTDALRFIVAAWREAWDAVAAPNADYLSIKSPAEIRPYWLCLDEMNLAPVEQYFADYLSVIETRKWEEGVYTCDPILKAEMLLQLSPAALDKLKTDLGLAVGYDALWKFFTTEGKGIPLPPNLIVAGTVNMDETTHGFSRKVIDRALSFDFGEFFPNDFDKYFSPNTQNLVFGFPLWSDARISRAELAGTFDTDGAKTVAFMKAVNSVLDNTPFKLAYRALNEILLSVISASPKDERSLMAVWDDFIMCKVLPRIEGDADKLAVINAGSTSDKTFLTELLRVLAVQLNLIWEGEVRPDLYRKYIDETNNVPAGIEDNPDNRKTIWIKCRAKNKLEWMQDRLTNATFTSFWP